MALVLEGCLADTWERTQLSSSCCSRLVTCSCRTCLCHTLQACLSCHCLSYGEN
jgi:hypothetical protein